MLKTPDLSLAHAPNRLTSISHLVPTNPAYPIQRFAQTIAEKYQRTSNVTLSKEADLVIRW